MIVDREIIKMQIIENLKPLKPEKVILFGSYAYGTPNEDSDIDLYVVTNDDYIPANYKEKSEVYLKIARAMQDFLQEYPTDLITHTKLMHKKFKELNSSFAQEIMTKGITLI